LQDYLAKYPQIDAVWCQDDDMAVGVLEAIKQANRTDIKFVVGGAGMKDMVKRVMDGDKMIPVDVLYPPAMVAVAMTLTAANLYAQLPVRGPLHPGRDAGDQGQRQGVLLPRLAVLTRPH